MNEETYDHDFHLRKNNTGLLIHANMLEAEALKQIKLILRHPAIKGLVAIMPDGHAGAGCVIGFTGRFKDGCVIPNIVGVDIGCGVITIKLGKIDIDLYKFDMYVRNTIPLGFLFRDRPLDLDGLYLNRDCEREMNQMFTICSQADKFILDKNCKTKSSPILQLASLGGGNHFIELEKGIDGYVYLTIHTGSRNFGKQVADYYQKVAKQICSDMNVTVPKDMEYLPIVAGGSEYLQYLHLAQNYAILNRLAITLVLLKFFNLEFKRENVIESVHNYIDGSGIIRKGAISARKNEPVTIPLNMGQGVILGVGKGNPDYNYSAPHGAGRAYGRKEMFRKLDKGEFSMDDYNKSMEGIYSSSICYNTFDESPAAYKPFEAIEKHLRETVSITEILRPIYNIKATGGD
jgi:tRNA-splicing ligase RtcB (3'-phosphate/5'-hydroxy nucleic acid ligase)